MTLITAPMLLLFTAIFSLVNSGCRPRILKAAAEGTALVALAIAVGAIGLLVVYGPSTSPLIGAKGIGLSVRLDTVSATMLLLVAFVGWIVIRFACTYLEGEVRQSEFIGLLCATIASVLLLVLAGNLFQLSIAWIATSFCLQRLLLFYPDRTGAQRAARKKRLFSSIGAMALVSAMILLALAYQTTDIATINFIARSGDLPAPALVATLLLAVAALLKSAQFPTHGWLTEVMEAPTPVSALLHAGVINAGGFLLIRFADLMLGAPGILAVLAILGGFTALFGALVMLTQPAVKTSLAWSTVAQMGFMTLQCGFALFPLALLHIVAHSLYKAHAFLASGGAIEQIAAFRRLGPVAVPHGAAVGQAFLVAIAIYSSIGVAFSAILGFGQKSPQAFALGAILIFGVAYLLAQGLAGATPRALKYKTAAYSLGAAIGYFSLQTAAEWLASGALPTTPTPGRLEWTLMALAVFSFGFVAIVQAFFPIWSSHPAAAGLRVHLSNGLYINAILDRMLGGWSVRKAS